MRVNSLQVWIRHPPGGSFRLSMKQVPGNCLIITRGLLVNSLQVWIRHPPGGSFRLSMKQLPGGCLISTRGLLHEGELVAVLPSGYYR